MTWWQAVILGLVEGITEYLPISSTGHLILTTALLGLDSPEKKRSIDALEVVIQTGAILAVVIVYRHRVQDLLRGIAGQSDSGRHLLGCLLVAFFPVALLGPLLNEFIARELFHAGPVLGALFVGGVAMIGLDPILRRRAAPSPHRLETLPYRAALAIGLFQATSMWPGTSRAMVTLVGAVLMGLSLVEAAEFSFLLGLITLSAASGYAILKDGLHAHRTGEPNFLEVLGVGPTLLGIAVAAVSAALAVRWLARFLTTHGLAPFGWYRIGLSLLMLALSAFGFVSINKQ